MARAPINSIVSLKLSNVLTEMPVFQRDRQPERCLGCFELNAIDKTSFRERNVVVMDEDVGKTKLLEKPQPGEKKWLRYDDRLHRRIWAVTNLFRACDFS